MATGVGKHKVLSLGPTEPWSVREKLCLASSVMRSGDQNWVSVSRAIKPFSEPGRPPDWFSQKHCASQYSELLETTEAPKRKRGEKGEVVETVEDVIVRRLTAERIEELKRLLRDAQEKYRKLKKEAELIQAGHLDTKLEELWGEIVQKKKQEEEEAEQKRKATDAAYQVRQAVKNTPKRVTSVAVRSPLGGTSPGLESPLPDPPPPPPPPPPTPDEPCATPTPPQPPQPQPQPQPQPPPPPPGPAVFVPLAEPSGPAVVEASLGPLLEDSPQKKLLSQKATPPASPLLSELLKKGSLLAASPRLVGDGDIPAGLSNGASAISAGQATTGAPTLSRLLEASPAQFPAPLGPVAAPELPNAHPPPAPVPASDSTTSLSTGEDPGISAEAVVSPSAAEVKAAELGEEDLVAVSYIGDELDLETVGDIIAIIEEKVDDCPEALDAAAVEAALSLCEDAAAGHALSGPWESADASGPAPDPLDPAPNAMDLPTSSLEPSSAHADLGMKEPGEDEEGGNGGAVEGVAGAGSAPSPPVASDDAQVEGGGVQAQNQGVADGEEGGPDEATPTPSVKCESEEWTQPGVDLPCADSEDSSASGKDSREVKEEDGGSDADEGSVSEMKESGDGDGDGEGDGPYLSELEPPASESEDGFSLPTPSLQRYATADSAPSSPASSQFSMCSEDQEAIQAQKIWKKAIMLVWRAAANHRYASVFLQPVSDDIAPGYHSIVHRPMDLSVIKKNIEAGLIRTTAEFQRDIMLMFQNAVMYNSSDHDVYHMALEMQRDVLEQIQQFLATQLIMQTSESGISAKSLRGRESSRKDSTDKDSLYGQEFDEGAWLAEYEDGSTGSDTDVGAGPAGSPAHSETDRESPTHAEGGRSGGGEEGMDTTEGGEESGNESPATEEEEQEEEEEEEQEEERGREREGGVVEGCATPVSQEDGVTRSEEGPDAHVGGESEAAGADHCASEQGSPYSEDRPPCATESPGRRSSCQDFRKLLRDMCNDIAGHKYAELFLRPVNEKFAPHYYSVVKRPVDLQTLRRSVSRGGVVSLETLNHQLMLMFQNALMFNSADSQVYQGAQAMQREVLQHVQMLIDEVQSRDQSGSSP